MIPRQRPRRFNNIHLDDYRLRVLGGRAMNSRNADIVARYEAGEKLEAIGALYGVSRQRIEQIARHYGCEKRPKVAKQAEPAKIGAWGRVAHEARNREVVRRRRAGQSYSQIAQAMSLGLSATKEIARKYGRFGGRA